MQRKLLPAMLVAALSLVLTLVPLAAVAQPRGGGGGQGGRGGGGGRGAPVQRSGGGGYGLGAPVQRGGGGYRQGAPGYPGEAGGHYAQHGTVVVGGGYWGGYYGYPYGGYWGGYWGPYGGWGGYWGPYGYPGYYDDSGELRLEIEPKEAQVYVDGYFAGIVDDFDGTFQRLRMSPGGHELEVYLKGYQLLKKTLYLGARQATTIKGQLVALAAGEAQEGPPQPVPQPGEAPGRPGAPAYPAEPWRPAAQAPPDDRPADQGRGFGSLVFRVQPAGAEVTIDGERWQGPAEAAERLVVQVSEGSHRIEIRKDGFSPFTTTVQVRRGETMPVNVSLPPRDK
jgi:hypothetical protein